MIQPSNNFITVTEIIVWGILGTITLVALNVLVIFSPEWSRPASPPQLPPPSSCNTVGKNKNIQGPEDKGKLVQESGTCLGTTVWFNKAEESIAEGSLKTNFILQKVIATLKEYPHTKVRIEGHTDQTGPEESNNKLSEKRATSMASFFKREGIAPNRITSLGYGASCLADSQNTTSAQAKNRRVELRIIPGD